MYDIYFEMTVCEGEVRDVYGYDIEPTDIGTNGEFIYESSGMNLVYYPEANTIELDNAMGLYAGRYIPVIE